MKPFPLLALSLVLLPCSSACGGKKGGSGPSDPPILPNAAPVMQVPAGLVGTSPRFTFSLPVGGAQTLNFAATDADGDPLLWQVSGGGAAATAAGLGFMTPTTGSSFRLEVRPVSAPIAVQLGMLVEDPRGSAAAIDLLVVRTGPPSITAVTPNSAFRNQPQQVTVTGSALLLGGTVTTAVGFDGLAATGVVVLNDTTLTCATPATAAIGSTVVSVAHTFGTAALPDSAFTMYQYPPSMLANDQQLDSATTAASALQLALDGTTVHAVWIAGNAVVHRTSVDAGTTWAAAQTLTTLQVASEPQVLVAGTEVAVAWIADGTSVWLVRSTDGGTTFLPAQRLDAAAAGTPMRRPRLCQSGDRRYAAWLAGDAGLGASRVLAVASANRGASWTAPALVSDGAANQNNHELACDAAVAWVLVEDDRLGASQRGILVVRTTDSGASWGLSRRLNLPGTVGSQPRLCAAAGRVHACWLQSDALFYNSSADNGLSWSNAVSSVQGSLGGVITAPALCCAADRVFLSYVVAGNAVWVSRFSPLGSSAQHVQVESTPAASAQPRLGCIGNYVFLTWREGDFASGASRVQQSVSVDGGTTFLAPAGLGNGTAAQDQPQLLFDGARLLLGWLDSRNANVGVFVNRTAQ